MAELTEQAVRDALRAVIDPELGDNVVDLGMVKQIGIIGDLVSVGLVLTTPDCPLAGWIVMQARRAIDALPGVADVQVVFEFGDAQQLAGARDDQLRDGRIVLSFAQGFACFRSRSPTPSVPLIVSTC